MTDWIADAEAGSSVRAKLNAIPNNGSSESLTSGASPVNASNAVAITRVTTGGTAGNEDVVLPDFEVDENGSNADKNGTRHMIIVETQTNPGDVVRAFYGSAGSSVEIYDTANNLIAAVSDGSGVTLDFEGAIATFVWHDYQWFWDNTAFQNSSSYTNKANYVPASQNSSYNVVSLMGGPGITGGPVFLPEPSNTWASWHNLNTGASAIHAHAYYYHGRIITGGTAGSEDLIFDEEIPAGEIAAGVRIGQRYLFSVISKGNPADSVSLDPDCGGAAVTITTEDGSAISSIVFDAVGEYLLIEKWDWATWRVVRGTATVTPA